MDRATLEKYRAVAERHVTDGERLVARQRELIAQLEQTATTPLRLRSS
jgi:hypothetical protein